MHAIHALCITPTLHINHQPPIARYDSLHTRNVAGQRLAAPHFVISACQSGSSVPRPSSKHSDAVALSHHAACAPRDSAHRPEAVHQSGPTCGLGDPDDWHRKRR
ncbi:uncharacterized protein TrAtP1_006816 [Trichoderma atroviride]|uniref:uncharacterized protein n=1 Tax=Hypocrea atroviridis TaxID=63577 RepID=UPI003332D710|nr:hypothetical protein TrAtP1_006816 [Trichoderma atroviride]